MPSCLQSNSMIDEANCGSCCSSQRPFEKSRRENEATVEVEEAIAVGVGDGFAVVVGVLGAVSVLVTFGVVDAIVAAVGVAVGVGALTLVDVATDVCVDTLSGRDVVVDSCVEEVVSRGVAVGPGMAVVGLDVRDTRFTGLSSLPVMYLISRWKSAIPCCTPLGSNKTIAMPTTAPIVNRAERTKYFTTELPSYGPDISLTRC